MLVDTNILLRTLQPHHPLYDAVEHALEILPGQGRNLCLVPQNCVELWAVATRPTDQNGLGFSISEASEELARIKAIFSMLPETRDIYPAWERLVTEYGVSGKKTHDARLVAAMQVHGLSAILTFDTDDFQRYTGIEAVHPDDVA